MEAVGVLGGDADGRARVAIPLPNLAGDRAFLADPRSQFEAERALRQSNLILLAIYHTHPGGGVQLSALDRAFAIYQPVVHLVIALARPRQLEEEMRAYKVNKDTAIEVEIRIE